jgi:hypothetical protein
MSRFIEFQLFSSRNARQGFYANSLNFLFFFEIDTEPTELPLENLCQTKYYMGHTEYLRLKTEFILMT